MDVEEAACDVAVNFGVHFETEGGGEDEDAFVVAVVSTAEDAVVDAEAKERNAQGRETVDVADDDFLVDHAGDDDALASNWYLSILGGGDVLVVHLVVGDEKIVRMPEAVGSDTLQDCHLCFCSSCSGKYLGWARRNYLREGGGESWWTRREYRCYAVDGRDPGSDYTLGVRRNIEREATKVLIAGARAGEDMTAVPLVKMDSHAHAKEKKEVVGARFVLVSGSATSTVAADRTC